MSRFFSDSIINDIITLTEEDSKHLVKVLRAKPGDEIEVCDGKGKEYKAKLIEVSSKCVKGKAFSEYASKSEPKLKVTIFQGLPKGSKMELIIQKCVEIGVFDIVPVATERAVVKIDEGKKDGKVERWNKISHEAAKQSGRGIVPVIHNPISFKDAVAKASDYDMAIIPYENMTESDLKSFLRGKAPESIAVFIGPEGGFDESEIDLAKSEGIRPVSLGRRILRTETAPLSALSVLMYEFDW